MGASSGGTGLAGWAGTRSGEDSSGAERFRGERGGEMGGSEGGEV